MILGLGCGGIFLLGIIGALVFFMRVKSAAEEIMQSPEFNLPTGDTAGSPATGTLQAELRDLREFKGFGNSRAFVGEIHNTGTDAIGIPSAKVIFYDAAGTAVTSSSCMSIVRALPPGEKVPCSFTVPATTKSVSHKVEITPMRAFAAGQTAKLEVTDVTYTPKKQVYGMNEMKGKVTNQSDFEAKGVIVIVSLYDKAGKIVGATQTTVAGSNIPAGGSARFTATLMDVAGPADTWQVLSVGYRQ
ncbi:FxLYD domain-containing protein [Chondromyces crocatus]|uniref:Uncharacterized protein n=1 Tax=Chondromyces crocatus TaxID=52 RepID=A0A0K1EI20_CHOCO|nr:FxLYD domain-containing protein [Chondromyces crocatus]AKT40504.1 uncharacterized protein CMC5_046590 [Chondromyces crocatus]